MKYCACGYDTYSTKSCEQYECKRFASVEMKKANDELQGAINTAMQKHNQRIQEAVEIKLKNQ